MRRSRQSKSSWCATLAVLAVATIAVPAQQDARQNEDQPRDLGLREETERRLVQIDVSLQGPAEEIRALTRDDFSLKVMTRVIQDFTVDRVCRQPAADIAAEAQPEPSAEDERPDAIREAVVPTQVAPTTYLFYFDHDFMTVQGNNEAPRIAQDLIPQLIRDGNRAMVVSSGRAVKTYVDMTDDPEALIAGIDGMYADHATWWNPLRRSEDLALSELMTTLNGGGSVDQAIGLARSMAAEERWLAEKAFRRFSMVLGRLADLPQPKAVIYFADRLRRNPGEHYLSYFSNTRVRTDSMLSAISSEAVVGQLAFDRVVNESNAHGVRLYSVQAEGLQTLGTGVSVGRAGRAGTGNVTSGTRYMVDAQNTLRSMSAETGGQAFLNGVKAKRIATSIEQDLACVYLVSFDAAGFPLNDPIPVAVSVKNSSIKLQHRGQVFIQSDDKRTTSRLLAAFTAPDTLQGEGRVHGTVIPMGYEDGKYTALVQLSVEGSPLAGATWDLGMSVLSRDKVREDASERVRVGGAGTPIVFEKSIRFAPGPYEIVLVAHETTEDRIATGKIEGNWPVLDGEDAAIGPIAVMQPAAAVFLRDGQHKTRGALGYEEQSLLRTDRPTAIISLVCWHASVKGMVRIERALVGDSAATFPPIDVDASLETCAPILDQIPADTMGNGEFTYELRLTQNNVEVASGTRKFAAAGGRPAAADTAADTGP